MKIVTTCERWAALWRSKNLLDGERKHIINKDDFLPALFRTRREAREFIDQEYGYIRTRRDLREEPHGWKIPIPVRVKIVATPDGSRLAK